MKNNEKTMFLHPPWRTTVAVAVLLGFSAFAETISPSGGDDYSTIQTAIDNAGSGGTVTLGSGVWKVSQALVVKNGVTLAGATGDPADVILKTTATGVAFATVS